MIEKTSSAALRLLDKWITSHSLQFLFFFVVTLFISGKILRSFLNILWNFAIVTILFFYKYPFRYESVFFDLYESNVFAM